MRNVFTEAIGDLGQCEDPSIGFEIRAEECEDLVVLLGDSNGSGVANPCSIVLAVIFALLAAML